jgi:hypothetical protein
MFFICSHCYRGQRYCSDTCRAQARRQQRRAANGRHQRSEEGRLDHRDRQRAYRQRRAAGVTDQSSGARVAYGMMAVPPAAALVVERRRLYESPMPGSVVCRFCGRRGRWVQMFHERE